MSDKLKTSNAGYSGGTNSVDGASIADLKRGYVRGDNTHDPYGWSEDPHTERESTPWEHRRRGGFLTRPLGDER